MATRMHATQVYLEPDLADALRQQARREGTSMGELIRRGARKVLDEAESAEPWQAGDSIWQMIGAIQDSVPGDVSRHVDDYLYPRPRQHEPEGYLAVAERPARWAGKARKR